MNARSIFSLCLVLFFLFTAGCTQAKPPETPVPTTTETTAPAVLTTVPTTFVPPTTEQVQQLPAIWGLEVQVYSNGEAINPMIEIINRGGKGLNFINQLDVTVTRSDGIVETGSMTKPMYVGKTLELKGTTQNNDRVEVWAYTPENNRVKIIDKIVPFRSYN